MRILVTGGTGYLGRHLVPALQHAGHEVIALGSADCDLTRDGCLDRWSHPMNQIWHLAAWTQAGDFCLYHPGEQWVINQRINTNVLDWWRSRQPQAKLIAIGTSCSYACGSPLVEDAYLLGEPVPELYAYGMTKRMLLIGTRALAQQFGLKHLCLVPSTLFGPGYHTAGRQMHFIFDLIRKIVHGSLHGEPVVLWGDGHQRRELVYVHDFVRAAILLSQRVDDDLVNIGSGQEFSIRWYAQQICRIVGYPPEQVLYDTSKYVGVSSKQLVIDKMRRLLPEFELTPIDQALKETVTDYVRALGGTPLARNPG